MPLFITQFFGAFNDNLLKNALVILITYTLANRIDYNPQFLVTIAAGVFILPFFIFSALAGQLADKYDRAKITRIVKIFEVIIMCLACIGFALQSVLFLIFVLFLSGVHSTFFGPIKYALLPQQLHPRELLVGNAYIESGTFLAILLGTICGGILIIQTNGTYLVSLALLLAAILGLIASYFIPQAEPPMPKLKINYNLIRETFKIIAYSRVNQQVFAAILCISWFWFIGATFLAQLPSYVKNYLHTEAKIVTLFLTIFSIGIGVGSIVCSKLLRGKIRMTYVPAAAIGMSIFIADLYIASGDQVYFNLHGLLSYQRFLHMGVSWRISADLFFTAVCGGIYIVPLYTMLQHLADKNYLARIIAATNIFNALFMVLSVLLTLVLLAINFTIPEIFLTIAVLNILVLFAMWHRLRRRKRRSAQ
jgi:acyl-[acyl-carrier-protein]-phospholipid O-acyltransferase/long-chain-fatty-acid--[acyl-carrier-protein] ligase